MYARAVAWLFALVVARAVPSLFACAACTTSEPKAPTTTASSVHDAPSGSTPSADPSPSTDGSSERPPECAEFSAVHTPRRVEFRITNARARVIELIPSTQCLGTLVTVEALDGVRGRFPTAQGWCRSVMMGAPSYVLACDNPKVQFLQPGESTVLEWDGLLGHGVTLPKACCQVEWDCLTSCELFQTATSGPHRLTLAIVERDAAEARGCQEDPARCRPEDYAVSGFGDLPHERVPFDFDAQAKVVEIRIE